jgi:hypothetical protein
MALKRLSDSGHISLSEYLTFMDIFLASLIDGVSYRNAKELKAGE